MSKSTISTFELIPNVPGSGNHDSLSKYIGHIIRTYNCPNYVSYYALNNQCINRLRSAIQLVKENQNGKFTECKNAID